MSELAAYRAIKRKHGLTDQMAVALKLLSKEPLQRKSFGYSDGLAPRIAASTIKALSARGHCTIGGWHPAIATITERGRAVLAELEGGAS